MIHRRRWARPVVRAMVGRERDQGQAAVELALALPLVFVMLLAAVQVLLVGRDELAVVHAAREGARAAAVAADATGEGTRAATAAAGLDRGRLSVAVQQGGDRVTVVVRYRAPTDVPLVGAFVGDVVVTGTATMRVEP
jgi:Flp pilus assembly protein TadG